MGLNFIAIAVATILDFIFGAIWYGPVFGGIWGKIHGFDNLPKEVQKKMMAQMGPLYGVQFAVTILTNIILAIFISYVPDWNAYALAAFIWLGFVVPAQVSSVLFGGTDPKWITTKIALQAGASLACLEIAAAILHMM